jgi:hypothetical protein
MLTMDFRVSKMNIWTYLIYKYIHVHTFPWGCMTFLSFNNIYFETWSPHIKIVIARTPIVQWTKSSHGKIRNKTTRFVGTSSIATAIKTSNCNIDITPFTSVQIIFYLGPTTSRSCYISSLQTWLSSLQPNNYRTYCQDLVKMLNFVSVI